MGRDDYASVGKANIYICEALAAVCAALAVVALLGGESSSAAALDIPESVDLTHGDPFTTVGPTKENAIRYWKGKKTLRK